MNKIRGVFLAQWWNMMRPTTLFWGFFAGFLLIHLFLLHVVLKDWVAGNNESMMNLVVLIFFFVTGSMLVGKMLPMTLSLSGTRFHYIVGTTLFLLVYSAANSLVLVLLGYPEVSILSNEHYRLWINFFDMNVARPDSAWLIQTLILFVSGMFFAVLSALRLRTGIPVYLTALAFLIINLSVPALRKMWVWIALSILNHQDLLKLAIGLLAAGIALVIMFWALLARISLKTSHSVTGG